MKKFMILDFGFEDPTPEILEVWGKWFEAIADKQVDHGGFSDGREISESGTDGEADTHQSDRAVVHPKQQRATSQNHAGCPAGFSRGLSIGLLFRQKGWQHRENSLPTPRE